MNVRNDIENSLTNGVYISVHVRADSVRDIVMLENTRDVIRQIVHDALLLEKSNVRT